MSDVTRIFRQARWDVKQTLRNGEQLILTAVLPVIALVVLAETPVLTSFTDLEHPPIDIAAPGVLALAALSSAFTGQAIGTGFDRRDGVLRFLATTPLGRSGFVAARGLSVVAIFCLQLVVLGLIAVWLGWSPNVGGLIPAALFTVIGIATFVALGLLLAGTLRAEATLALTNLLWVLLVGAGLLVPSSYLPSVAQPFADALPSTMVANGLRAALLNGAWSIGTLLGLMVWCGIFTAATVRWFRWQQQ